MGEGTPTPPPTERRSKGVGTIALEASAAAALRSDERDARQDARTDKAWQAALDAAEKGHAAAQRTVKMLYVLLAASLLAVVVLVAMVLDAKLNVSKDGVRVGADNPVEAAP